MTTTMLEEPISTVGPVSAKTKFPSNLSWDEFLALPQETRNAALIDGEVIVNSPSAAHENVVRNLIVAFTVWTRGASGRGDLCTQQPVKIHDRRGYQPDFAWYAEGQCSPPDEGFSFTGLPSLVVEVFSPSTRIYDAIRKRADYESVGISELWFVDPLLQIVTVCRREGDGSPFVDRFFSADDEITSPLLPGFSVKVSELSRRR